MGFGTEIIDLERCYGIDSHQILGALSSFFSEKKIESSRALSKVIDRVSKRYGQNIVCILFGTPSTEIFWKSMIPVSDGTISFNFYQTRYLRAISDERAIAYMKLFD